MKAAVLFGSPHKDGHTARLFYEFAGKFGLKANDIDMIYACDLKISGCVGCDKCKVEFFCPLDDWDKVSDVYRRIRAADICIVASPVYFGSFPSQLKALFDRLQPFYYQRFERGQREDYKDGILIMTGGGKERDFTRFVLEKQIKMVFDVLFVRQKEFITRFLTDETTPKD